MKTIDRRLAITGSISVLLFMIALAPLSGEEQVASDSHQSGNHESVRVRYARANLRLAEIELEMALTENEKIRYLYSAETVERLRNNVAFAEELLRHETHPGNDGLHSIHLRELEGTLKLAESELSSALEANTQVPGSISLMKVERLRAAVELARLALEKARDPAVTQSPIDHLQWQLERLRSELTRLYVRLDKVESHN